MRLFTELPTHVRGETSVTRSTCTHLQFASSLALEIYKLLAQLFSIGTGPSASQSPPLTLFFRFLALHFFQKASIRSLWRAEIFSCEPKQKHKSVRRILGTRRECSYVAAAPQLAAGGKSQVQIILEQGRGLRCILQVLMRLG